MLKNHTPNRRQPAAKIAARRKKSELDFEQSRVAIQRQVEQTIKVEAKKRDRQFHKHHDALRAEETGYMQEIDAFLDYRYFASCLPPSTVSARRLK